MMSRKVLSKIFFGRNGLKIYTVEENTPLIFYSFNLLTLDAKPISTEWLMLLVIFPA